MKGFSSAKFIFLQPPSANKQGGGNGGITTSVSVLFSHHNRLWLVAFLSFFTFASLLTFLSTTTVRRSHALHFSSFLSSSSSPSGAADSVNSPPSSPIPLPSPVFDTLVNYAVNSNFSGKMKEEDLRAVAAVLRRRSPCNLLIFGLGHETPLWRALNIGGRTVFVDENEYYIAHIEGYNPGLEAYDVAYTTKIRETPELIAASRQQRRGDCRPVQNLLYSDCPLAINDLPNKLYDVAWDVILVDGPRGYSAGEPGRMMAIFTAGVMARTSGRGSVDVLVHDHERRVEKVFSAEFLCPENKFAATRSLGHYVIRGGPAKEFCTNQTATASSSSSASGGGGGAAS